MRFSPSIRRAAETTSCDVGPSGLSTTRTPSTLPGCFDLPQDLFAEDGLELVKPAGRAASRCVLVAAAAKFLCDRVDVDVALRPHADAPVVGAVFLEEHHGLD